jgi:colanic acid biosynthesis glycosyl transferase WcaI
MIRALWRADRAFVVSPALTYAAFALVVAALMRVPRTLVVKDVMPDAAVELGMLRNRVVIALSRFLARWAYRLSGEIQTLGEGMRRRIATTARRGDNIRIVPDTVDLRELAPVPPERNEFRKRFVPPGTYAVVHSGNMGKKQDLGLILKAASRLRDDPRVHFYVFGDGAEKAAFLERRAAMGLENVSHYPLQPRSLLPHTLSGADVVLVSQLAEVVDIVVPSKLLTAMASGAMIVAACSSDSETARLVRESGGGIVIGPGDDAALVGVIDLLRGGAFNVVGCREKARGFACTAFDRKAVYGRVVSQLLNEMESNRAGRKARSGSAFPESVTQKGVE